MKTFNLILVITFAAICLCLQPTSQDLFELISQKVSPIRLLYVFIENNVLNFVKKELPLQEGILQNSLREIHHKPSRQKRATKTTNKQKLSLTQPKECGLNGKSTGRVKLNGPSDTTDWPWIAALLRSKSYSNFCGGVLLNRNYVLTAAHCVSRFGVTDMYVRLGEYDLFEQNETVSADFSPLQIKIHPEYDPATEQHDIALLKLNASAKYSDFIRPICLPTVKARTNQTVVVAGWGTVYYGGPLSNILMEVPLPVWDLQNCISKYTQPVFDTNLCAAAYEGGKDACQGDSGGPLLMQQANGRWVSIGVVSWGISCGEKDQPGIYTNVAAYLDWITANMQDAHL